MPSYIRIQISLVLALSTCSSVLSDRLPCYGHTFDQADKNEVTELHTSEKSSNQRNMIETDRAVVFLI